MKKKNLIILLVILLMNVFVPLEVFAHPGGLNSSGCHYCRTNCAKWGLDDNEYHCHSGNTYSNSKGQTFNSEGVKISDGNSSNNTPSEPPTPSTPPVTNEEPSNNENVTPPSANNNSSGGSSSNGSISSGSISTSKSSGSSSGSSSSNAKKDSESKNEEVEETIEKSSDTSIKTLKVNGKSVDVVDSMYVETTKRSLSLKITTTDKNAKVDYELKELEMGNNEFKIKVTAEDGTDKEYKLIVKRVEGRGTVTISELTLGSNEVVFDNYKAKISILKGEVINDYSYKLSNNNAQLKLYVNDKEVERIDKLKDGDILTLVTIDEDNNELEYEVAIEEMGAIESAIVNIIAYTVIFVFLAGPIAAIIFIIKFNKKKVKK